MMKHHSKYIALFLTAALVVTAGLPAFGANGSVETEAAEGEAPEILGLDPEMDGQYATGFIKGDSDRTTDHDNKNEKTDEDSEYFKEVKKFTKTDDNLNPPTLAYQAGYYDGYSGKVFDDHFTWAQQGFNQAYNLYSANTENARKEYEEGAVYPLKPENKDAYTQDYIDAFKVGYESGKSVGQQVRYDSAYQEGFNTVDSGGFANHYLIYAKNDSFLKTKDPEVPSFEDYTTNGALKDFEEKYVTAWKNGYKDAYDLKAKNKGYDDGRNAGSNDILGDGNKAYPHVKDYASKTEDDINALITEGTLPTGYLAHWKTYNGKWEKDADNNEKAKTAGTDIVGESYIANYKRGYDDAYKITKPLDDAVKNNKKGFYNEGFADGYAIGVAVGRKNDESLYTDDKENDDGTYHKKVNNKSDEVPPGYADSPYLKDYINGYEFGYKAAFKTTENNNAAYNDGYNDGYESGRRDAENDKYEGQVYDGFYEPADPTSAYSKLTDATQYGKGYRKGYDEGYAVYINGEKNDHRGGTKIDRSASEYDAWRISSDPATWDTAQLLIGQDQVNIDGGGVYENYFFDTYGLKDAWDANPRGNIAPEFRDKDGGLAGVASAQLIATSPFQYYFDLYGNDHLIDKKTVSYNLTVVEDDIYIATNGYGINNGSVGMYNYAALPVEMKAKKGVSSNSTPYILVRYRLAGAETDENYKVKRFSYDANGNETVVVDHITDYYQGTDKDGNAFNEPVVPYDSRKIVGKKLVKKTTNVYMDNDKTNRYIIDAEALLITWEPGKPAVLVGPVNVEAVAKDNINATVSHNYLNYKGETDIAAFDMPNDLHGFATQPVELKQTDKGIGKNGPTGANYFSKYYTVAEDNKDETNEKKAVMGRITFAGAESVPKLTAPGKGTADIAATNAFVNKKGAAPSFTLKAKKVDPALKAYSSGIKKALKKAAFTFEISRMKMASDYVDNIDTIRGTAPYQEVINGFVFEDTEVFKLLNPPVAPKRSEFSGDAAGTEKFKEAVRKYVSDLREFNQYKDSDAFKVEARKGFQKAIEAYIAQVNEDKIKYGSHLDYFRKWIEEDWAVNNDNIVFGYDKNGDMTFDTKNVVFPYTVTKEDRTLATGELIPVGATSVYKDTVREDANCDGIITAIEHYEYTTYGVDDPRFDGVLKPGDNIVGVDEDLINGHIEWDDVDVIVNVTGDPDADYIEFTYKLYKADGSGSVNDSIYLVPSEERQSGIYFGDYDGTKPVIGGVTPFPVTVYYDFLEDRDTDIEFVENIPDITVLWPGSESIFTYNEQHDDVDVDFIKPMVKGGGKKGQTLTIQPMLHIEAFNGWLNNDPRLGIPNPKVRTDKKLKTSEVKANSSGGFAEPKPGKADLLIYNYQAESEPFIVAKGVNNYEGQIAIRQRQNGDVGFGYFKNDDFYYVFNDEE